MFIYIHRYMLSWLSFKIMQENTGNKEGSITTAKQTHRLFWSSSVPGLRLTVLDCFIILSILWILNIKVKFSILSVCFSNLNVKGRPSFQGFKSNDNLITHKNLSLPVFVTKMYSMHPYVIIACYFPKTSGIFFLANP